MLSMREPVARTSADPTKPRIDHLKSLFPDIVSDGKVDFDKLRSPLGEEVVSGSEKFTFGVQETEKSAESRV